MFMASNGCGSTIPCSCPNGQTLVNGDCKAQCIPTTKYPDASMNCGYVDDGCGGSVQLATCSIPGQVCGAFKPNTCGTPLKDSDYVSLLVADVINLSPTCAASCLTNIRSLSDLQTATSAANLTAVCGSIMNLTGYKSCATSACQSSTTNIDRVSTFVSTISVDSWSALYFNCHSYFATKTRSKPFKPTASRPRCQSQSLHPTRPKPKS
ncbi:hypothetical protein BDR26DRAFT_48824 [Obelidium mucronatum]|nr:hypothetical protein BDR26DRAFT_48824 [Obelidium mucronatum]